MKHIFLVVLLVACLLGPGLLSSPASPQRTSNYPKPPQSMDTQNPATSNVPNTSARHLDFVRLQTDADSLARTAQSIPSDIASVRKGMLPKDLAQKLKEIEKLSKRLRSELNP